MPNDWQYNADTAYRSFKVQQAMIGLNQEERMEVWRAFRHGYSHGIQAIATFKDAHRPNRTDICHSQEIST